MSSSPTGSADTARTNARAIPGVKIALSRLALGLERIWPELWPAMGIAGTFLALSLFGVWAHLPLWLHVTALLIASLGTALALVVAITEIRWPTRKDAIRRLEVTNELPHRPLTTLLDTLGTEPRDPLGRALWETHRARMAAALRNLRLFRPRSRLGERDPYALRAIVLIGLIAGFVAAGDRAGQRLLDAFAVAGGPNTVIAAKVDAWVTPPTYTGKPPVFLTGIAAGPVDVDVPQGSALVIRVHGTRAEPTLVAQPLPGRDAADGPLRDEQIRTLTEDTFELTGTLDSSLAIRLLAGGRDIANWTLRVTPDTVPEIAFEAPLAVSERLGTVFAYTARDDYGVRAVAAEIRLDEEALAELGLKRPPNGSDEMLTVPLPIPAQNAEGALRHTRDLTGHDWAGLPVRVRLVAYDIANQQGVSQEQKFVLPERRFEDPLARAIIEQRKALIIAYENAPRAAKILDALTIAPEHFFKDMTLYLGMRLAVRRLTLAREDADIESTKGLLFDLALRAEDGGLTLAEQRLRELMAQLSEALTNGASDEEVKRLTEEVKEALQAFLDQAARNADEMANLPPDPNMEMLERGDLENLLDTIDELSRQGARDQAQQMLSDLQGMLDNLQTGAAPQLTPEEQAMSDTLDSLEEMIERQRGLLDETFREQMRREDPRPQSEPQDNAGRSLSRRQEELRQELQALMQSLGESGASTPNALGEAEGSMGGARDRLREKQFGDAAGQEQQALEKLRQGARGLSQQLMQSLAERGAHGRPGGRGRDQRAQDPLGRETGARGSPTSDTVKVPDTREIERAREIFEELQRRAGERGRPVPELDYIERLLRRF